MKMAFADDIKAEILAQYEAICTESNLKSEYTFHHNIDYFLTPDYHRPTGELLSKRECVATGRYAAYRYSFLDINESEDIAASRIAKMLNDALEESISANGAPVEVAFHPAINGKRLQDLTPYAAQRYQ
jgi:hypothetical protein